MPGLSLRLLTRDDDDALLKLLTINSDYTMRVDGRAPEPSDARSALIALPPGVQASNKFDLGLWQGTELLAFADVIRGWPSQDTAHVGLLMTLGHRRGLGRTMHQAVVDKAKTWPEIASLRISIVDTNAELANPFWSSLGYKPTGAAQPYVGDQVKSTARIWTLPLDT